MQTLVSPETAKAQRKLAPPQEGPPQALGLNHFLIQVLKPLYHRACIEPL